MPDRVTIFKLLRTGEGAFGLMILAILVLAGLLAPWLSPNDPLDIVDMPLMPFDLFSSRPLGTDRLGRDIAAGLFYGARTSLVIAGLTMLSATLLGIGLGASAGYRGGWLDQLIMRTADALQTIPNMLLVMAFVAVMGPSVPALVLALTLSAWTLPARLTRAEVLGLRDAGYVLASRLIGRSPLAIALKVVLPNAVSTALAITAVLAGNALLIEAALSFLGLGNPNTVSWGSMIAEGRAVMRTHPHVIALPGLALFLTVLAIALVGEGLARARSEREI